MCVSKGWITLVTVSCRGSAFGASNAVRYVGKDGSCFDIGREAGKRALGGPGVVQLARFGINTDVLLFSVNAPAAFT